MRVAACQLPFVHGDVERALVLIEHHVTAAERQGVGLICFPECFLQGYDVSARHVAQSAYELQARSFGRILERLGGYRPLIVLGMIESDAGKFYNTVVVLSSGTLVARYRKAHLVGNEPAIFTPGSGSTVFDAGGIKVGINICYDLQFAQPAEAAAAAGAELLVCPCNNMLSRTNAQRWKPRHNEIRCARASGARIWILSSDVTGEFGERISYGPTALIDPSGNVVAQLPLMTTGMLVVDVPDSSSRAS